MKVRRLLRKKMEMDKVEKITVKNDSILMIINNIDSSYLFFSFKSYLDEIGMEIEQGAEIEFISEEIFISFSIKNRQNHIPIEIFYNFVDKVLKNEKDVYIECIHEEETVRKLAENNSIVSIIFNKVSKKVGLDSVIK